MSTVGFGTDWVGGGPKSAPLEVGGSLLGRPSLGLSTGEASDLGWAIFKSLICLVSYLLVPSLYDPTSIFKVDLDGLLCTLKGPMKGVWRPVVWCWRVKTCVMLSGRSGSFC